MARVPDCHAHLDAFSAKIRELLAEWEDAGIGPVISAGIDSGTSQEGVELAWELRNIKAAVGLHPWKVGKAYEGPASLEVYGDVASDPMVVAISEVGLDTESTETPLDTQCEVLKWFIRLAQDRGFPVILHLRAPIDAFLDVWDDVDGRKPAGVIHGFAGDSADAEKLLARGLYLSLGPRSVGLLGNTAMADDVVRRIPDDKLHLDSDAFPAQDHFPEVRPSIVLDVARRVAEIRGTDLDQLKPQLERNFAQLLRNQP